MTAAMSVLKSETSAQHAHVEDVVAIEARCASIGAYGELLRAMAAVHLPLERALAATPGLDALLPDLHERVKSPWLTQDLSALGIAPGPDVPAPAFASAAHALGCCYVIEGATLGGAGISRIVARRLGLTPQSGAAFFTSYGEERGARWRAFGAAVEESGAATSSLVAGARAAFSHFATHLPAPTTELAA